MATMDSNSSLTDCGVSDKCLFILQHWVDGQLFAILSRYDGNRGLLIGRDRRHLFNHLDLLVLVMGARERVEIHRLDEAAALQREQNLKNFLFRPAIVAVGWNNNNNYSFYLRIEYIVVVIRLAKVRSCAEELALKTRIDFNWKPSEFFLAR